MKSINVYFIEQSSIRYLCCRHLSTHSCRAIRCGHIRKWAYVTEVSTLRVRENKSVNETGQCHTTLGEAFLISFTFYQPARDSVPRIYIDRILYKAHSQVCHSVFRNTVCSNRENGYVYGTYIFKTKLLNFANNEMTEFPSVICDVLLNDAILYW